MFRAYEFTFAGIPSALYGMVVSDVGSKKHSDNSFGNKANIVEKRLPNRITPLHYGVKYHEKPLTFPVIFGSERRMDRYEIQEVANWLTGYQDYQWLTIDQPDMEHIQFRALVESLTPVSVSWFPVAFEANIVCDCPYGYSYPFQKDIVFNGETKVRFYNDSTIRDRLKPDLRVQLAQGCRDFSVENKTTGAKMCFEGLPAGGVTILADNENEILQDENGAFDPYEYFNFGFFNLSSGDNELVFHGAGTATISGRYLYNVGA